MLDRKSIWNERQNRPTLVVRDLVEYAPPEVVYESLLRRGVFKWLAVRRSLIKLKNAWKCEIVGLYSLQKQHTKKDSDYWYWRGYREAMEQCRKEVRRLCHSDRWQAPDIDKPSQRWLKQYEESNLQAEASQLKSTSHSPLPTVVRRPYSWRGY